MSKISQVEIDRYAAGPSSARVANVAALQNAIRARLPSEIYETLLQGSYRNDTAIADINDVDIVALRKSDASPQSDSNWAYDFNKPIRPDGAMVAPRQPLASKWRPSPRRGAWKPPRKRLSKRFLSAADRIEPVTFGFVDESGQSGDLAEVQGS